MKLFTLEADLMLNAGSFDTGVKNASTKMGSLKTEIEGVAGQAEDTKRRMDIALGTAIGDFIGKMAGALTEAVFEWTGDGIALASSMEETNAKINTIFGDSADNIHRWAETTKDSFGIGELTAKNYAAQIAGILSTDSKNLTSEEITHISTSLVELAGDLASFHNMNFDDVWGKLLSGLRGETEAIEALGIDLRAANLADAFGMTTKQWSALDQRSRLLNTYQYIMQETALAQGDFARTSDSYANQMRVLEENINSLKLALGESLLPVMTDLIGWFNALFGAGDDGAESMKDMGTALGQTYATIDSTAANALALVDALAKMEEQGVDTADEQSVWNQLLIDLSGTLPGINSLINETTGALNGGTTALKEYVLQWQESQKEMATMQALQNMQNEIASKATEVSTLQFKVAASQMTEDEANQRWFELIAQAGEYYFPGNDEFQYGAVIDKLQKESKGGDVYAEWILGQIEDIENRDQNQAALEQQLLAAQSELDQMNAKYLAIQSQVDAILAESQPQASVEGEKESGEGAKGSIEIKPNFTLQVTLNGEDIAATLTPKVTGEVMNHINWKFEQIAR